MINWILLNQINEIIFNEKVIYIQYNLMGEKEGDNLLHYGDIFYHEKIKNILTVL